jgi:hypothetical protein
MSAAASPTVLDAADWQARDAAYSERLATALGDYPAWRKAGRKHPVVDFLFTYYSFSIGRLRQWSPGIDVVLTGDAARAFASRKGFATVPGGVALDPSRFARQRLAGLRWTLGLLDATAARAPFFGCFGLHEWAMVYHTDAVRHQSTPLRLSPAEIDAVVESQAITCTHYDAFRFFTPDARPLNRLQPDADDRLEHEQPACLHANMDLYKWSYKLHPWLPAEHLLDCFELAMRTRELDMRASPYDLRDIGYDPIPIETPDGRRQYTDTQREIAAAAAPLRTRLSADIRHFLRWLGDAPDASVV